MAKSQRANLGIVAPVNDLSEEFRPLPSRGVAEKMPPASEPGISISAPAADVLNFPSLAPTPKKIMVSKSIRIPLDDAEKIAKLCKKAGTDDSKLIRDFISAGLERIENGSK